MEDAAGRAQKCEEGEARRRLRPPPPLQPRAAAQQQTQEQRQHSLALQAPLPSLKEKQNDARSSSSERTSVLTQTHSASGSVAAALGAPTGGWSKQTSLALCVARQKHAARSVYNITAIVALAFVKWRCGSAGISAPTMRPPRGAPLLPQQLISVHTLGPQKRAGRLAQCTFRPAGSDETDDGRTSLSTYHLPRRHCS